MLACPWPPTDPMTRELASRGYYSRYHEASWGGVVPEGLPGSDLLKLIKELEPEYKKIFRGDPLEECKKRGALEGYETTGTTR
jgi:hypothetical protein